MDEIGEMAPDLQVKLLKTIEDKTFRLQRSLERHGNNISAAARALHMTRETLRYRVDKFGLLAKE